MSETPHFISVDAALLAKQAEKLEALKTSVEALTKAVAHRPTRQELDEQARRNRLKRIALAVLVGLIAWGFWQQQNQYLDLLEDHRKLTYETCNSRNTENAKNVKLLTRLSERQQPNRPRDPLAEEIVADYIKSLEPVDCSKLLHSGD